MTLLPRLAGLLTLVFALNGVCVAENWPRFRGPLGTGHTTETDIPVKWTKADIAWTAPLKGEGQSSPVIWGDRIFLTSALDKGKQRLVFCLDRKTGKVLWEHVAWKGTPEPTHVMNGYASSTCVTDGERVYASFGFAGLHAYTVEGKHLWSEELGKFQSKNKRGTAASLALVDNLVIFNGDSESDPFLFGIDKLTGKTVWKADRPKAEGYSTPILIDVKGKRELVLNGDPYVAAFDPASGKQLWKCKSFNGRGEPTVTYAHGLIYAVNGLPGDVYAIKPGGDGDVTKSHMAWHTPRKGNRDQPSPLVIGDYLLVADMKGLLTCYNAKDGKQLWRERICSSQLTSAPMAANGLAYFIDEKGVVDVIKPGPKLEVVSHNDIGSKDLFRASPVPCDGQLFLRSNTALYCIGKK
ncbi:MAG: PQQ-binding-like beta-propeller repeat protein [Gemmataceae bacterium]